MEKLNNRFLKRFEFCEGRFVGCQINIDAPFGEIVGKDR
jgi:hypothetical protein